MPSENDFVALDADYKRLRKAVTNLLDDIRRRYPGEELRCPYMRALDELVADDGQRRDWIGATQMADDELKRLRAINADLLAALECLLHETMYKNHPEASQMAIDAILKATGK